MSSMLIRLVFLDMDNQVKLGDFGLSKIMQSHDFASTYVGTPFYMSPEIICEERYTLRSDVWSLGCIAYELCAREPPFNAKTHLSLCQKIKLGKYPPLPSVYSAELQGVINNCLQTNPNRRPDTNDLLNLPVVKLMRKEKEVVEIGNLLKNKEEAVQQKVSEAEARMANMAAEREKMKAEIDAGVRREWEVKAKLEIDRQVQIELHRLQKKFDAEVKEKVAFEVAKQAHDLELSRPTSAAAVNDIPTSSITAGDISSDFPDTTEFTNLSIESPESTKSKRPARTARTPFGRAQTMGQFVGTPMDIEMAEPSPISITSLSLSPRRNGAARIPSRTLFGKNAKETVPVILYSEDEDDDDDTPALPSPSQSRKPATRPGLTTQKTMPLPRLPSGQGLASKPRSGDQQSAIPSFTIQPDLRPAAIQATKSDPTVMTEANKKNMINTSPTRNPSRRLSKMPVPSTVADGAGSPTRRTKGIPRSTSNNTLTQPMAVKPATTGLPAAPASDDMIKAVTKNNMMRGRTLVELANARIPAGARDDSLAMSPEKDKAERKARRQTTVGAIGTVQRMMSDREPPPVWNPEIDEMPSPFLDRSKKRAMVGFR
jgi:NIMA (never in mitosis gene a)-related kinase 2